MPQLDSHASARLTLLAAALCSAPGCTSGDAGSGCEPPSDCSISTALTDPSTGEPTTETTETTDSNGECADAGPCEGDTTITDEGGLTDLADCESLSGDLTLLGQDWITEVELPCLESIGGGLYVGNRPTPEGFIDPEDTAGANPGLVRITLPRLTEVGRNVIIAYGASLETVHLPRLSRIDGYLWLLQNSALVELDSLSSLSSVAAAVWLSDNSALTQVDGLVGLESIGGLLEISSNDRLESLDGLSNVETVGSSVYVIDNPSLCRSHIDQITGDIDIGSSLVIEGNDDGC